MKLKTAWDQLVVAFAIDNHLQLNWPEWHNWSERLKLGDCSNLQRLVVGGWIFPNRKTKCSHCGRSLCARPAKTFQSAKVSFLSNVCLRANLVMKCWIWRFPESSEWLHTYFHKDAILIAQQFIIWWLQDSVVVVEVGWWTSNIYLLPLLSPDTLLLLLSPEELRLLLSSLLLLLLSSLKRMGEQKQRWRWRKPSPLSPAGAAAPPSSLLLGGLAAAVETIQGQHHIKWQHSID